MYSNLGQLEKAEENYKAAIQIDDAFYPAKVNLAMLYNHMGKNDKAELLLREVVKAHPELYETAYSLGLLLAEKKSMQRRLYIWKRLQRVCRITPAYITIWAYCSST